MFYFWFDLASYTVMGVLLAYLLKGMLKERFVSGRFWNTSVAMCLQYAIIRQILSQSVWVKQLVYGEDMFMVSSRQSIVPMAVSLAGTLLIGFLLYKESGMKCISLVTAFYALTELVRFTFYAIATWSINRIVEYYSDRLLAQEGIGLAEYQELIRRIELVWNVLLTLIVLCFLTACVRQYKKYLISGAKTWNAQEAAVLLVPELLGLAFCTMLRCILFYYQKPEIYNLIENYPELNIMIPAMSLLCIASILLSVKMLSKVSMEHEKRCQAEIYQSYMAEFKTHVWDMESVQVKLHGMKHDMKNYIADIQALLAKMAAGDEDAEMEVRKYVDSMQETLESLEINCQTGSPVTDVILGRYIRLAEQKNITFSSDFFYPKHLGMDVFDISTILNNGVENALEACEKQTDGKAYITLSAKQKGQMFFLVIENSFYEKLQWEGEYPVSRKSGNNHGLGIKNMRNCVEKYYGKIKIEADDKRFRLVVMLQSR